MLHDDVSKLGPGSDRAAIGPSGQDEAAANSSPERQHDEVVGPPSGAPPPLGHRSRVRIVVDANRKLELRSHPVAKVDLSERNVHRGEHVPPSLVDLGRQAEADRCDLSSCEQRFDRALERGQQLVL